MRISTRAPAIVALGALMIAASVAPSAAFGLTPAPHRIIQGESALPKIEVRGGAHYSRLQHHRQHRWLAERGRLPHAAPSSMAKHFNPGPRSL